MLSFHSFAPLSLPVSKLLATESVAVLGLIADARQLRTHARAQPHRHTDRRRYAAESEHGSESRTATVCNRTRIERAPGPRSERAQRSGGDRSATQRFARRCCDWRGERRAHVFGQLYVMLSREPGSAFVEKWREPVVDATERTRRPMPLFRSENLCQRSEKLSAAIFQAYAEQTSASRGHRREKKEAERLKGKDAKQTLFARIQFITFNELKAERDAARETDLHAP